MRVANFVILISIIASLAVSGASGRQLAFSSWISEANGGQVWLHKNISGVVTDSRMSGFLGDSVWNYVFLHAPNGSAMALVFNNARPSTQNLQVVFTSNDLETEISNFTLDSTTYAVPGFFDGGDSGYAGLWPNDEEDRYIYAASSTYNTSVVKLDLWNGGTPVNDSNWPMLYPCPGVTSTNEKYVIGSLAVNTTHLFVACYSFPLAAYFITVPRANPNGPRTVLYSSEEYQLGQIASDDTYLYIPKFPGSNITRYNHKTGELEENWTALPMEDELASTRGVWTAKMYREYGVDVLYIGMYYEDTETYTMNMVRRVNPKTGMQLSVPVNESILGMVDFYVQPEPENGALEFVSQPYIPAPPPQAAPQDAPAVAPQSAPQEAPQAAPQYAPQAQTVVPVAEASPPSAASHISQSSFSSIVALAVVTAAFYLFASL